MQLKISRSHGNHLVLQLPNAILTHFTARGAELGIELADGKEGDDQFRKFLPQAMEDEPIPLSPAAASRIEQLEEENAFLRQTVAALTARIDELTSGKKSIQPSAEHIFAGKSRAWLEGFAANRLYRLNLKECEELNSPSVPVEPRNPYDSQGGKIGRDFYKSWESGYLEALEYQVGNTPDPTSHLEQAK